MPLLRTFCFSSFLMLVSATEFIEICRCSHHILKRPITHTQVRTASHFGPSLYSYASTNQGLRLEPTTCDWVGILSSELAAVGGVEFMGQLNTCVLSDHVLPLII